MLTALIWASLVFSIVWSIAGIRSHRRPHFNATIVLQVPREVFVAIGKADREREEIARLERMARL